MQALERERERCTYKLLSFSLTLSVTLLGVRIRAHLELTGNRCTLLLVAVNAIMTILGGDPSAPPPLYETL